MTEVGFTEKDMQCDYCEEGAVLKFRISKLVRYRNRYGRILSCQWIGACSKHLGIAIDSARGSKAK
jgi:hypothetical protein